MPYLPSRSSKCRFRHPVLGVLLLSLWVAGSAWAGAETDKLKKLHSRGKLDKATELCQTLETAGGSEFSLAKDTCAQVHRDQLDLEHPGGLSRAQLDDHALRWPTTAAGESSREQAAHILLAEAGQSIERLNQVTWTYQQTPAAQEARTRIFQIAFDRAKLLGSPEAYADYRQTYPDSPMHQEALDLEQEAAFDQAFADGTAEAMQAFVAAYPDSPEVSRAQKLEMDYAFHEAGKAGNSEAWHTLYKQFVAHPRRHEIQTRWYAAAVAEIETRGVGPLLMYTAIHPSDATARDALEQAVMETVSVALVAGHPEHPGWPLSREGEASIPRVSQLSKAVQVRFPHVSNNEPEIRVLAEKGASVRSLQGHLQATFRLTQTEAKSVALTWRSPEEGLWEARLPLGLCQPKGTRFLVEVKLMGETLRFPFRSDTPCADWAVPMVVWNGEARRGGTRSRGAWTPIAGELPPFPHKDVWWTGGRFEHTLSTGTGTVVTWPDGTRYWRPGTPGKNGRSLQDLLVLPSFSAPGFSLFPEGSRNVLRHPGQDPTTVATGLVLEHQVWLAATRPPGQGRTSSPLDADTGWIVSEATGAWQPLPPEGSTQLELRFPTPEILATWTEQLQAMTGSPATIRWSAMVDLDLDDQLEGFVCLEPGEGDSCWIGDWRDGGPAWFPIMGFDWPSSAPGEPFAFWTESGVYMARVDDSGAAIARYTGTAYLGTRQGD